MAGYGTAAPKRIEDEFYKIMRRFNNKNWLQFARNKDGLALPEYQIDDIQQDYSRDTKEQKYQMLTLWKRKNNRASIDDLNRLVDRFFNVQDASMEPARNPEPVSDDVAQRNPSSTQETGQRNLMASQLPVQDNKMHEEPTPLHDDGPHSAETPTQSMRVHGDISIPAHAFSSLSNQGLNAPNKSQPIPNETLDSLPRSIRVHGEKSLPGRALGDQDSTPMETTGTSSRPKTAAAPIRNTSNFDRPQTASGGNVFRGLPNFGFPGVDMRNAQINVYGQNAIGMQVNTVYRKNLTNLKLTPDQLKKYCSVIDGRIDVLPSDKTDYGNHFLGTDIYRITHNPKGAVLIINNMVCGNTTERKRSEVDIMNLETMWEKMGCKTILRTRSDAEEARATFKKFADSKTASQSDFIAIVILAKGDYVRNAGVFYGADGDIVNVKATIEAFNDENAIKLRAIPKLFFFQFCVENKDSPLYEKMTQEICEVTQGRSRSLTPNMMILHAVQPSKDVFSNFGGASWYINAITNIFKNHACNQDVHQLIKMVKSAIIYSLASATPQDRLSCDFRSTLAKKLFLFPGFPEPPEDEFD